MYSFIGGGTSLAVFVHISIANYIAMVYIYGWTARFFVLLLLLRITLYALFYAVETLAAAADAPAHTSLYDEMKNL